MNLASLKRKPLYPPIPISPTLPCNQVSKSVDHRAYIVFQRLQRFYTTLNIVSALHAGLALAVLTFDEFHPAQTAPARAAEGLLVSSALSSVISIVLAIMLMFQFEGREKATRRDLAMAWVPLVVVDLAIVEFLLGLVLWYCGKNRSWESALMVVQFVFWMGCCVAISSWMWVTLSDKGGLGMEEMRAAEEMKRTADD